jgi:hypothetical protein
MMKRILLAAVVLAFMLQASAQDINPSLDLLASYMQGSFTSIEQAKSDTDYFEIELEMARFNKDAKDGVWLYVEQATATKKEKPYRQRVYHVRQVDANTFTSTIMSIKGGDAWYGSFADPEKLNGLSMDSLQTLEGCAITLTQKDGVFSGSTDGRKCTNAWGKATYATSEVTISPGLMVSWDRGYNDAGEQVWGAEKGGYRFVKKD